MFEQTRGRSLRIYLASGEVTGIRHAELANWTGQALTCPRGRLAQLQSWDEAKRPGVYFLLGAEVTGEREVYIGEAENVLERLKSHASSKDFWQEVVLFTSKDAHVTKAHVKYLEHRLLRIAKEVGRCELMNSAGSRAYTLSRPDTDAMEDFIDNLGVLLGALGHRFLIPLGTPGASLPEDTGQLKLVIREATAFGGVTDEGFLVYAGSEALTDLKEQMGVGNKALKVELMEAGVLVPTDNGLRFTEAVLFTTPSQAAAVIYGNAANGRVLWKDHTGRTLKELEALALREAL